MPTQNTEGVLLEKPSKARGSLSKQPLLTTSKDIALISSGHLEGMIHRKENRNFPWEQMSIEKQFSNVLTSGDRSQRRVRRWICLSLSTAPTLPGRWGRHREEHGLFYRNALPSIEQSVGRDMIIFKTIIFHRIFLLLTQVILESFFSLPLPSPSPPLFLKLILTWMGLTLYTAQALVTLLVWGWQGARLYPREAKCIFRPGSKLVLGWYLY